MIKNILKFLFAAVIIYWLVQKGEIDFSLIPRSMEHKKEWVLCIFLLFLSLLMTSYRWKILVQQKNNQNFPFLSILKLTWIGAFFSCVLPGAVTGDLIKLIYARDLDRNLSKTFLLTSILIDRVIGLIGLITLCGLFSLFNYHLLIDKSPQVAVLVHFNFVLLGGAAIFIGSIFLPPKLQGIFLTWAPKIPFLGKQIEKTLQQVWIIGQNKKAVLTTLLMSVFSQALGIISFWTIITPFLSGPLPLQYAFTFMPLGFITIAIPISPAGLGVGHAAFAKLFSLFGITGGASLFNLYFLSWIVINMFGSIPYLFGGHKHSLKEAQEMEKPEEGPTGSN
jgi:glycosyltransferase 2 family protein